MKVKIKDLEKFSELLIRKGFTKAGFCRAAVISTPMLSQLMNGNRNPSPTMALKITEALGIEFDDIFVIERNEKQEVTA